MTRELTDWEQRAREVGKDLVITLRDAHENVTAELVILEGTRVIIGPDGNIDVEAL